MKWSIYKEVDGVITDDSKKYMAVRDAYLGEKIRYPATSLIFMVYMNFMIAILSVLFRFKFGRAPGLRQARAATARG